MNKKYINPKTGRKYMYYDQKGNGIEDFLEWAKILEERKKKIVKQEYVKFFGVIPSKYYVSTVWLGLDHAFHPETEPLIFETMVFHGDFSDLDMDRYTTRKQALAGHKAMVRKWQNPFYIAWRYLDRKTWGIQWKIKRIIRKIRKADYKAIAFTYIPRLFFLTAAILSFGGWFVQWYESETGRILMSFGMGSMFVHSILWIFRGDGAIKHAIWCKNRKECGEPEKV